MTSLAQPRRFVLTFDTDWAPDFMIDYVATELLRHAIPATWFVTHCSPAIERLREHVDLFELGIHPNFAPGSSHGSTPEAVLDHCFSIVPEAVSVRMHGLMQSGALLAALLRSERLAYDASLFTPYAWRVEPTGFRFEGRELIRVPYIWSDNYEWQRAEAQWDPKLQLEGGEGLRVFGFHPAHVYLNSSNEDAYNALKNAGGALNERSESEAQALVMKGAGTGSFFAALLEQLAGDERVATFAAHASRCEVG